MDPVREYLDARKAFEQAKATLEAMANAVESIFHALHDYTGNLFLTDVEPSLGTADRNSDIHTISAALWPDAGKIQRGFRQWHETRARLVTAWDAVSPEDRELLQPPPEESDNKKPKVVNRVRRIRNT